MPDFAPELRDQLIAAIPVQDGEARAALRSMPLAELLVRFFTWTGRLVHPHPRQVYKSGELLAHPMYCQRRNDIRTLFAKIAAGISIRAHLSRDIEHGFEAIARGSNRRRRDLDGLLNEWGVHHLHLSHDIDQDGFVRRPHGSSNCVLACIFREEDAFALDIIEHGQWTDQRIVEIAVRNWPRSNLFVPFIGATLDSSYSSADRAVLRRYGADAFVTINGQVYMGRGGGLSTARTPSSATIRANRVIAWLEEVSADPAKLAGIVGRRELPRARYAKGKPKYRLIIGSEAEGFAFSLLEVATGNAHNLNF